MIRMKFEYNQPENHFDENARVYKNSLPRDSTLPGGFYGYKKLIHDLVLLVIKIDACKDGCMLFSKNDKQEEF